ncbi:Alpha beta hydrolase [Tolypocladium capitatum]|uniref:Alpha beta hydrolase n=1 Tax=Tolypocladium capitatum TaxID=45235 RepID=A0A2K3Q706_9HYPO|nr:Alpha beta hydrolase [Tolypocladium capitatum]
MHPFFSSPFWDFELTRLLGTAPAGGCDAAEFLQVVGELRKHDPESWYRAWLRQAETVFASGLEAEQRRMGSLARGYFLRAANYFRTAPYMLFDATDERILACSAKSIEAFEHATAHMNAKVLALTIPYTDERSTTTVDLPAYLVLPPESKRLKAQKTPLVVVVGGADSTMEEMYFMLGATGPELGYAVLLFDGPGQGRVFKSHGVNLRPDFEVAVSSVLDRVWELSSERPDLNLDLEHIALAGVSMGGYYALRGAAADQRVAAVVAGDPFFDMWEFALTRLPGWFANAWMAGYVPDGFFNWSCRFHMSVDFPTRWEFGTTLSIMGQDSPANLLREFQRYTLREDGNLKVNNNAKSKTNGHAAAGEEKDDNLLLSRIKCPVMLTGASLALYQHPEESTYKIAKLLVNVPEQKKELWIPGTAGEGALTAKVGAWYQLAGKSFSFLDKHWEIVR